MRLKRLYTASEDEIDSESIRIAVQYKTVDHKNILIMVEGCLSNDSGGIETALIGMYTTIAWPLEQNKSPLELTENDFQIFKISSLGLSCTLE
jgi:hypothetical protein